MPFRDQQRDRSGSLLDVRDPVAFVRAQQAQQAKRLDPGPERPFAALATLLMAGIGGWALVRQFPKARITALAHEVKNFFANPRQFGIADSVMPKLRKAFDSISDVVGRQPWAHVHKDKFGDFLGSARAANQPEVQQALRVLVETAEQNPKNFVHVMSIQRSKAATLVRPIPQDTSGLRSLTLGDLFSPTGGWRDDVFGAMPENYKNIHDMVQRLTRIRGVRGSATDLLRRIKVDPGTYIRRSSAGATDLVNLRGLSPSRWLQWIGEKAEVARGQPFMRQLQSGGVLARIADWTSQLLAPTELLGTGPSAAVVGGRAMREILPDLKNLTGGVYVGGQLFPRFAGGALGRPLKDRYILGRATSAMGRAARMRVREVGERALEQRFIDSNLAEIGGLPKRVLRQVLDNWDDLRSINKEMSQARARLGYVPDDLMAQHQAIYKRRWDIQRKAGFNIPLRRVDWAGRERPLDRGPVGVTARYLREHGIYPYSARGLAVRAGGRLGVGPQFAVGGRAAETALETGGEALVAGGGWVQSPNPLGKMLQEAGNFLRGEKSQVAKRIADGTAEPYFVATRRQAGGDFFNYLIGRVGRLAEEASSILTRGRVQIGVRPGTTPLESLGRWVGLGLGVHAAWQGLQYTDYHMRQLTGTGPLTAPLQLYSGLRVAGQAALAGVGIQQSADYLENLMPGLVNSPLSRGARAFGVGRYLQPQLAKRFGMAGAIAGWALAGMQLTDIGQSPANLAAVYRGEVDVPVREARFWALGTQPYTGGRILYTRPHLIPTILSRAGTVGRYGSEAERWKNSFLPTPESWFGLRPLLDPYRVERQQYAQRPYPLTAPMFQDVPFVGPLLSATVGELIKPTQRWHQHYWQGGQLVEPGGIPFQGPPGAAAAMGFPQLSGLPRQPAGDPGRPLEILGKQIDVIRDFLGMPGFLLGAIKRQFTGEEDFFVANRQIATAGRITAAERSYYDMELGGLMGMTELFRRFVPHRRRQIELVNPIPNLMPSWLPGTFSAFPQDRQAARDFHRGDPYAAIRMGEARLPGPGYELLHRMHSGVPGVYDAWDRWRILRDVAPTSQAFRHYDTIVRGWAAGSHIANQSDGKGWEQILGGQKLRGVVRSAVDGDTIVVDVNGRLLNVRLAGGNAPEIAHSQFEASLPDSVAGAMAKQRLENHVRGREVEINVTGYNPAEGDMGARLVGRVTTRGWGGRDVSADLHEAFPAYNLTPAQQARVWNTRHDLERRFQPYPFTERIFQDPFAPVPRNMRDLTNRSLSSINQAIQEKGAFTLPEKLLGRAWESVSHITLPGPLNWPVNKLFAQRDPLEVYRMQVQGGMEFANWATPVQGFIQPWMNQVIGAIDPSFVQPKLQRQRVVEQGLDALAYAKYRHLEHKARDFNQVGLAQYYRDQQVRTVTGALITGNQRFIRGALPRMERGFFTPFQRERDPGRRQQILSLVPENVGAVLRASWGEDAFQDRIDQAQLVHDLTHHAPKDWSGWHPDVPMTAMKVRIAYQEAWDIHDFGFTHKDAYLAEEIFAGYTPIDQPEITFSPDLRPHAYNTAQKLRLEGVHVEAGEGPGPSEIRLHLRRNRRKLMAAYDQAFAEQGLRF